MTIRIATFNLENLDDQLGASPTIAERNAVIRPQLDRVNADVLCLQEIHAQGQAGNRTLDALDQLIAGTQYAGFNRAHTETVGGELYRFRNLVVLTSFPITATHLIRDTDGPQPSYQYATANPPDQTAEPVEWERPMLHVELDLGAGRALHVINLHLKSKIAATVTGQKIDSFTWNTPSAWAEGSFVSAMKRVGQALQTRLTVDEIFDVGAAESLIAVCGDLNATADEVPVRAICGNVEDTGNPAHAPRVLVACEKNVPESTRYSLLHLGHGEMIDHILASRDLFRFFDHTEIHNETLIDESGAFRTDVKFPESDHAAVIAEFRLP
jgi:endonuclease/exonuclease/phosphatase family metal-dependent hydrolase